MLISLEWLQDYVDVSTYSASDLAETLTMLGLEVEGVQEFAPIDAQVVVGKVSSASATSQQRPPDVVCRG